MGHGQQYNYTDGTCMNMAINAQMLVPEAL